MDKVFSEIFTAFKEKISSPFFRYFCVSWILWNYKFVYFIILQDQKIYFDVHGITKFDYLMNCNFYGEYWGLLYFLLFPLLSALFFIYIFPKINYYFLQEFNLNNQKEDSLKYNYKESVKIKDLSLANIELKEKEVEVRKEQAEVRKEKATNNRIILKGNNLSIWKYDYEKFKKTDFYKEFGALINVIFHNDGNFYRSGILNEFITFYILNDIIIKRGDFYFFTEKGEYFAKLYFEESNKI